LPPDSINASSNISSLVTKSYLVLDTATFSFVPDLGDVPKKVFHLLWKIRLKI